MALIDQLRQDPRLADASDTELLGLLAQHPQFSSLSDNALRYAAFGTLAGAEPKGDDEPGFVSGLSAGVDQLQAAGGGLVMLAGDALESEGLYDAGKSVYQGNMAEAQENALGYGFTDLFSDPETSAWQWAAYTAGNVLPSLATAVAGGGLGGIAARGLAGLAAKQAATRAGQAIGSYVASAGMETGAIMGKVEQADVALAHGSIAGALDALPVMRVLRKAGGQELANQAASEIASSTLSALRRTARRGATKAGAIGGATQMLAEASTEGLQGLIEQHAEYWVANNGESLLANLGEADWKQIVDSAAAGGVAGLGLGAPVGVLERNQARQNQLPPDFKQPADANPDPMVYQNSEVSQAEADQAWAEYDLSPAMRERRAQQVKEEAIAVARQETAAAGGDALQQTQAAQQAEQLAEAVTQQEAPVTSPNRAAEVGNRIQIAMTLADDMVGLANGSTEGQARLRNMQGVLSRAEAAFDKNNVALAERLLIRAERIGSSLNANLQRSGSRERPAEGQLVEGDEGRESGIAGLIGQDSRRLPPGSGAIYAGDPTADTTQYEPQARNVRRDEGMTAQRQGMTRLREQAEAQPVQLTDQGIVYSEGPVPRRGNANTGMDQAVADPRFAEAQQPAIQAEPNAATPESGSAAAIRVMSSGRPFATQRSAELSGVYQQALREGRLAEAVEVADGWGVAIEEAPSAMDAGLGSPEVTAQELDTGEGEMRISSNGRPFPTERSTMASGIYRNAQREGKSVVVEPVDGGYAVRVQQPMPASEVEQQIDDAPPEASVAEREISTEGFDNRGTVPEQAATEASELGSGVSAVEQQIAEQDYSLSSEAAPGAQPPNADAVRSALAGMEDQLGDFTVIDSARDLPEKTILGMAFRGVNPRNVKGLYEGDTLYIIAGNNDSLQMAVQTAIHEAVGHKGMRGVLGDKLDPVMRQLYRDLRTTKRGKAALAKVRENYTFLDPSNAEDRLTIAEELVAHYLEDVPINERPSAWKTAVSKIRALLRQLFPSIAWTHSDVLALAEQSRAWLQQRNAGQSGNDGDQRFSIRGNQTAPVSDHFTDMDPDMVSAFGKIGPRTPTRRAVDWFREHADRAGLKIRQGIFDRNAALLELDQAAANDKDVVQNSTASSSWVLARMANAANGALHAMLHNGRVYLDPAEKVIDVKDDDSKGLGGVLGRLGSAAEIERFMGWIAGNRSARLATEGKENLFSTEEVAALQRANRGTTESGVDRAQLYDEVFAEFQTYRDDVLAIAEQSGIISGEQREMWRDEFYVPFYRISENDPAMAGMLATGGLSRQQAYKKLKGGTGYLNDLLQNTMMNFHHLIEASLKNQAALQAMDNAMAVGIAEVVPESNRDTTTSTFVMREGEKVFYQIDDPLVFKAITALASPGMNSTAMKVMRWFKRIFTNLTTITPQFMIANYIRDSLQAPATSEVSKNVFANMLTGGQSLNDARTRAKLAASGATFNFGHLFGNNPDELRAQLTRNMRDADIVSGPSMVPDAVRKLWAGWGDINNYVENVNRAAIYQQNIDSGKGKLFAAFESRDLIDFSAHGAWPAVRILIDVVPFLNARLQGLDKIYRAGVKPGANVFLEAFGQGQAGVSDKQAAGRFWAVTGAVAMASAALYLHNYDDEEYKKLEDWQKDTYWFLHVGDSGIFIPKPFEVGAISTLVERMLEQVVNDKATGELFAQRLTHMLSDTFSFSPVPQAVQPALNVYSNMDDFTNRPIESMGMDRLSPELRRRSSTTAVAQGISNVLNATLGAIGDTELNPFALSPVQVDHLIQGYFGQVGGYVAGMTDVAWRVMNGKESPASRWYEYQPMRRFYQNLGDEDRYTRYGTIFYDALRESQRAYSDVKKLREMNELEEAREVANTKREMLRLRPALNRAQADLRKINNQMDLIRRSKIDGELKRQRMDRLRAVKNQIQKALGQQVLEAKAG